MGELSELPELEVGAELYWVPYSRHRLPVHVTVEAIGRKWATLSNGERVNKRTLAVDAGQYSPSAHVWRSKEAYERHTEVRAAFDRLRRDFGYRDPAPDVTLEGIEQARRLLGLQRDTNNG